MLTAALVTLATAAATGASVPCVLNHIALDANLGNKTLAHGAVMAVCVDEQTGELHYLDSDQSSLLALKDFHDGDHLELELELSDSLDADAVEIGLSRLERVVSVHASTEKLAITSIDTAALPAALQLESSNRYFTGDRKIRLLSVLIEMDGEVPEYAGQQREEREAWAAQQRQIMSEQYQFSTFGKIGFDEAGSRVVSVVLGSTSIASDGYCALNTDVNTCCVQRGFDINRLAVAELAAINLAEFDGILYYQPEAATPQCGSSGYGILGVCYMGQLTVNTASAAPPYLVPRSSSSWYAGCHVRYQRSGINARANIGAHEFGHHLGLGHAGGSQEVRSSAGSLTEYGDSSAVMGNDEDAINSFTAPVRHYLGVIPDWAVETSTTTESTLRALTLGPDDSLSTKMALALPCPSCASRVIGGLVGGEIWLSFRGDTETCAPEHVDGGSTEYRCHIDHTTKLNKVTIHYRQPGPFPSTEKWYWLDDGESYQLPTGGYAFSVCAIFGDNAVVSTGATVDAAQAACSGIYPPVPPPAPSQPPSDDESGLLKLLDNKPLVIAVSGAFGALLLAICLCSCVRCSFKDVPKGSSTRQQPSAGVPAIASGMTAPMPPPPPHMQPPHKLTRGYSSLNKEELANKIALSSGESWHDVDLNDERAGRTPVAQERLNRARDARAKAKRASRAAAMPEYLPERGPDRV